ncbi:hypothetical protein SeMB42_g00931 [Synchytrium endobioticum]|uniref:Mitochondrial carrier protein n=1 Tax=Synchytrium endobioticum TaxID=286115 RepID=A0A507DNF1_9FUNG|nr:hypothetical protein SeLEV6574_g05664 [Synchytrium endobioticum]TPX53202.1 hypothetical protein SeMB42_g00931 [Synchytrium endobioticum]
MSPPVPSSKSAKKDSALARILGSGTAGLLELLGFHPVDTVAKRLMNNQTKVFGGGVPFNASMVALNKIVFRDAADKGVLTKWGALFPGLGWAAGYKILQRIYKFGGQPYVNDYLNTHHKKQFDSLFGAGTGKTMMHATAGSLVGIGEIILLPLDTLKIKMQTNPQSIQGKGIFQILTQEGLGLYRGATWTAARNAPGSFALFGGSAVTKEYLFRLDDYSKATWSQNFVASIAGAVASITVSAPLDVIKTRIQAKASAEAETGVAIVSKMIAKEGFGAFFKGLTPKTLVVGPKLIFSFTVAQTLIPIVGQFLDKESPSLPTKT